MTAPRERTVAALARFEQALRNHGLPLLDMLQPGRTDHEIAETVAPTGLTLPEEAAALWRWRNGVSLDATGGSARIPGSELLPGGARFLPLEDAVQDHLDLTRVHHGTELDDYSPEWFPVGVYGNGDMLLVDCGGDPTGEAPMLYWYLKDYNAAENLSRRSVLSVGEGIEVMAALVERGIWRVMQTGDVYGTGDDAFVIRNMNPMYDYSRDRDPDLPQHWP